MARRGGWQRLGRKRFRYVDSRGKPVTDEEALERIRELVIPPAWTDVWISPNPLRCRRPVSRRRQEAVPLSRELQGGTGACQVRALEFARGLSRLRARTSRHLRLDRYEYDWTCAVAVGLVNKAWFRVGSDRHARSSRTYGVTTLRKRHVQVSGGEIAFRFHAKNRRLVRRTITNATLAAAVDELLVLPGSTHLFRYEREGALANLTSPTLNAYLSEALGEGFTAKDFRTWGGTLLAAVELERRGPAASATEEKRVLVAVMRKVGDEPGNTAAVARASYVSPAVVEHYRAGCTLADFRSANGAGSSRLSASEVALLALLGTPVSEA